MEQPALLTREPGSTTTTTNPNNDPPTTRPADTIKITIPDPSAANDAALVKHIVDLVNTVYTAAEAGLFGEGYRRTHEDEIRRFLGDGELVLALASLGSFDGTIEDEVVGCIRLRFSKEDGVGVGEFGMGDVRRVRCELLVSVEFEHEVKRWLQGWYERLGYRVVRRVDFGGEYPGLAGHLITKAELRIFEKVLG
ncbi:hypothetical protein QBC47DRAFT_403923 [Echria macrotheca]|uniref:N-acetyltransferase domain-containing protein n=1 Tax=Echria macrotheca TaxID=438768 RepID=A0AAJ0F3K7_9PEZI|nr:hypothetical protein QBC47DRAFT_403923 [Echria macrotheca]